MAAPETKQDDYDDTPEGWAQRWGVEMDAAENFPEKFQKQADKCLKAYLDQRTNETDNTDETHLNVYWRNTQVQRSLMYGRTPSVEVSRKFGDANDGIARLAAEIQERVLNSDIEKDADDGFSAVMGYALDDRLQTGMGIARIRYVVEHGDTPEDTPAILDDGGNELAPAVPGTPPKLSEDVEVVYANWKDFRYSPCRVWHERRWVAFANEMSQKELEKRFTGPLAKLLGIDEGQAALRIKSVPMEAKKASKGGDDSSDGRSKGPWDRACVWEIWDGETKRVYWWVKGFDVLLDQLDDPLGLEGFFPCPRPMLANVTNSSLVPKPDYAMLQDLYREIDTVSRRITKLQRTIKVRGVYDKTAGDLKRLVQEGGDNELVPIDNFARWAEKGGASGQIDWLPLDAMVAALAQLRDYRTELMAQADQMSGMSDILRGEASVRAATATEQGIKAKFASIRMQALQDEFARFCSDIQRLKAEVMAKHFDVQTYVQRSNIMNGFDATQGPAQIEAAIQLIKSNVADYRIEVKPEAVAMQDYAAMKSERTEVIQGIGQFLSNAQPMLQQMPQSASFIGEMLRWFVAGLRGARSIEGELDKVMSQAEAAQRQAAMQPPAPPPPDPKVQAIQLKMQADQQKAQSDMQLQQMKTQGDLARIQAETQSNDQKEQSQAYWGTQETLAKHRLNPPKPAEPHILNGGQL